MAPSDVPDVLARDLDVVFVGINPGRVSAEARAHFANPRNDFWRVLHASGITARLYEPAQQFELLGEGVGVTNAAYRTTPGSGDLRRGDFAGSAERLERIARELHPRWLAFVGKEAYRGAFDERPELGEQERRLGDTRLFVLPSTSPANAAVPWVARRRWFGELAHLVHDRPVRDAIRAIVLDTAARILLLRFADEYASWWGLPGGGVETGEGDADALARELAEECGIAGFETGSLVAKRRQWLIGNARWGAQDERIYLVRVAPFESVPLLTVEQLAAEGVHELAWFGVDELARLAVSPIQLPEIVARLVEQGAPEQPLALRG